MVSAHVMLPEVGKRILFFVPSVMGLHHLLECDEGLDLLELLSPPSKPGWSKSSEHGVFTLRARGVGTLERVKTGNCSSSI